MAQIIRIASIGFIISSYLITNSDYAISFIKKYSLALQPTFKTYGLHNNHIIIAWILVCVGIGMFTASIFVPLVEKTILLLFREFKIFLKYLLNILHQKSKKSLRTEYIAKVITTSMQKGRF